MSDNPWHFWDCEEVIAKLETTEQGLSYAIARKRLREGGRNVFPKPPSLTGLIWRKVLSLPVALWLLGAIGLQVVGELGGAIVLGLLVSQGIEIGCRYWLSQLQQRGTLARREFFYPDSVSIVLRDREWLEISSRLLVLGDLVLVREGDHPAADLRLWDASPDLVANEVMIGCGAIAPKQAEQSVPLDTPVYQRHNMIYAGTEITTGLGVGWVVAVAGETEWQRQLHPNQPFLSVHLISRQNWQLWTIGTVSLICGLASMNKGQVYGLFLGLCVWLVGYACPRELLQKLIHSLGISFLAFQRIRINHPAVIADLAIVDGVELLGCEREVKRDGQLFHQLAVHTLPSARSGARQESPPPILAQLKGENPIDVIDLPPPNLSDEDLSAYIADDYADDGVVQEKELPENLAVYCRTIDHPERLQNALVNVCDRYSPMPLQQSVDVVLPRPHLLYLAIAIKGALIYHDRWQRLNLFLLTSGLSLAVLMLLAVLSGFPLAPVQIIWLGAIAVPCLGGTFLTEPNPEQPPLEIFQGFTPMLTAGSAIISATISLFLLKYQGQAAALNTALTMGFTTLFLAQIFHAIALSRVSLIKHWGITICGVALAGFQVLMVQFTPLNTIVGFVPLEGAEWLTVVFASTSVLWVQEILRASQSL